MSHNAESIQRSALIEHATNALALAARRPIVDTKESVWRDTMRAQLVRLVKTGYTTVQMLDEWQEEINVPEDKEHEELCLILHELVRGLEREKPSVCD